jgi:hypothetical protein
MTNQETKINTCKRLILQFKEKKQNPEKLLEKYPSVVYKKAQREIEFDRLSRMKI